MGYSTDFEGGFKIEPALNAEEIAFLQKFSNTRRMNRRKGPYFIDGSDGDFGMGQGRDDDIVDYNQPPEGQPGLWCQWVPTKDGRFIEWNYGEKFYHAEVWIKYIIEHFLRENAHAKKSNPKKFSFLKDHIVNGEVAAYGEERGDNWLIIIENNTVKTQRRSYVIAGQPVKV